MKFLSSSMNFVVPGSPVFPLLVVASLVVVVYDVNSHHNHLKAILGLLSDDAALLRVDSPFL